MNILNVNMSIDPVSGGGTAERTIQVARHLAGAGVHTAILTSDIGISHRVLDRLSGVDLHILPCWLPRFYLPRFHWNALRKLVLGADIVHLMNHWTLINVLVYRICKTIGKPYVVCPAGALPIYGRSKLLKKTYNALIGTEIIRQASGHIAIPAEEAIQYHAYGIDSHNVEVIPNGIDPADFNARDDRRFRERHRLGDAPFILFMGRLNIIKGPDLLLHAFAQIKEQLHDHQLVFAGPDGGLLERLKQNAHTVNISDRVHFIGYIGGREKSWAYHAADLLVIPSRQEAMSIVAVEAGITGTPVLMTDVCGFNQVRDIGGGIVVKPTVSGIRDGLLILENPTRLKEMGERLRRFVGTHYTWDSVIQKYIILFKKILTSV